jgi:hypothetical protein
MSDLSCHQNDGIFLSWFLSQLYIRNVLTSYLYRFQANKRWEPVLHFQYTTIKINLKIVERVYVYIATFVSNKEYKQVVLLFICTSARTVS